jgi:hypothetical protein
MAEKPNNNKINELGEDLVTNSTEEISISFLVFELLLVLVDI